MKSSTLKQGLNYGLIALFIILSVTIGAKAYATGHPASSGSSQNANLNSFQSTNVNASIRNSSTSTSGAFATGGKAFAQGGNATGGNVGSVQANNGGVRFEQPNQVASQGAVFAAPSQSQLSCDGTVGGAVNTPFSGLTAIWGHTDSTCPTMQMKNFLLSQGLEHEACLLMAQYAKDQDLIFSVTMCENVHNTNILR